MKKTTPRCSVPVLIGFLFLSSACLSQTAESKTVTAEPSTSGIVLFPIGTTNTTDPNYELNMAKYKDYNYSENVPVVNEVKDEAYYLKVIEEMKKDIADKENMTDKSADVLGKIEKLKADLAFLQTYYKQLITK